MLDDQEERIEKSMDALGKPLEAAKLFVTAECWQHGERTQNFALTLRHRVLYENGEDLSVHVSIRDIIISTSNRMQFDCLPPYKKPSSPPTSPLLYRVI
jgi:hypothetical protein